MSAARNRDRKRAVLARHGADLRGSVAPVDGGREVTRHIVRVTAAGPSGNTLPATIVDAMTYLISNDRKKTLRLIWINFG
jgi:hypothetical protein